MHRPAETDIAICGGGISGLYAAYHLKQRYPELRVSVFEATDQFGGKIHSVSMLGGAFKAEYGPACIEPDLQLVMDAFVRELGLPVQPIPSHAAGSTTLLLASPTYLPVGGMEALLTRLVEALLTAGVVLYPGHRLDTIADAASGADQITLGFHRPGSTPAQVLAQRVILALPQLPLQRLGSQLPAPVRHCLTAVRASPVTWACCVVKNPWWDAEMPPSTGEHGPVRAVRFETSPIAPDHGMVMFSCEEPGNSYWRHLIEDQAGHLQFEQVEPLKNCGARLRPALERVLQTTFELDEPPQVVEWGIRDWSLPPYGGGWHLWEPEFSAESVMRTLEAFSLGSTNANVHICGEAYSSHQGFLEGAIRSAHRVLIAIARDRI